MRNDKSKYRRMVKSRSKKVTVRKKPSHGRSPISGERLHGVMHGSTNSQRKRAHKTHKRPSVPFGGILGPRDRAHVFEALAQVRNGQLSINEVDARVRPFVRKHLEESA